MASKNKEAARFVLQEYILNKGEIIERMYEIYRRVLMPEDAGLIQIRECKLAFFAGAQTLLDIMIVASDEGFEATERETSL